MKRKSAQVHSASLTSPNPKRSELFDFVVPTAPALKKDGKYDLDFKNPESKSADWKTGRHSAERLWPITGAIVFC